MLVAMIAAAVLAAGAIAPANARGAFGLYPADDFRLTDGRCTDCAAHRAALWYFERETIAVPLPGRPIASFSPEVRPFDDIRAWQSRRSPGAPVDYPPLVWVESPSAVRNATIASDARSFSADGATTPLRLVDKIPLNRSYFDANSARYFAARPVALRGTSAAGPPQGARPPGGEGREAPLGGDHPSAAGPPQGARPPGGEGREAPLGGDQASVQDGAFIARTLWPEDFRLRALPPARALRDGVAPGLTLREWMREEPGGGAQSPYAAWTAWRNARVPEDLAGRTALAFMVNGAQGDDDEAHGGHFAIVTGRVAADGSIGDWLVNNFYTLDAESEKGIIAAPLPLDNYLGDLNSGQAWYRPSYMLVAVLSDERAAALVQSALGRVYNQFYRHQLVYYHPTQNCTSISVDALRALGWDVPARGPSSRALAWAGFPFIAAKEMSVAKAKLAFDYLHTDQTRLLPAAALEEIFASLLAIGRNAGADGFGGGPLAQMLAQDLDALVFLRFPQFPSSRAWGDAPAVTTWEYRTRVPSDPALAQTVPVPPRPFPERLRDPDLLPPPRHASDAAAWLWLVVPVVIALAAIAWWRRRNAGG